MDKGNPLNGGGPGQKNDKGACFFINDCCLGSYGSVKINENSIANKRQNGNFCLKTRFFHKIYCIYCCYPLLLHQIFRMFKGFIPKLLKVQKNIYFIFPEQRHS